MKISDIIPQIEEFLLKSPKDEVYSIRELWENVGKDKMPFVLFKFRVQRLIEKNILNVARIKIGGRVYYGADEAIKKLGKAVGHKFCNQI